MASTNGLLLQLIKDLIISADPKGARTIGKDLRKAFDTAPHDVLEAYELDEAAFETMVGMERDQIICTVEDELETLGAAPWDLPDDFAGGDNFLLRLAADFVSDAEPSKRVIGKDLRSKFKGDAAAVVAKYNLGSEAAKAITGKNLDTVMCILAEELDQWEFPPGEFKPDQAADCMPNGVVAMYPDPEPFLYSVDTSGGILIIKGQGFVSGKTRLILQPKPSGSAITILEGGLTVEGTFRCAKLKVKEPILNVPIPKGTYQIDVEVGKGASFVSIPSFDLSVTIA